MDDFNARPRRRWWLPVLAGLVLVAIVCWAISGLRAEKSKADGGKSDDAITCVTADGAPVMDAASPISFLTYPGAVVPGAQTQVSAVVGKSATVSVIDASAKELAQFKDQPTDEDGAVTCMFSAPEATGVYAIRVTSGQDANEIYFLVTPLPERFGVKELHELDLQYAAAIDAAARPQSGATEEAKGKSYRKDDLLELIDPMPVPLNNSVYSVTKRTDPTELAAWMRSYIPADMPENSYLIYVTDRSVTLYVYRDDFYLAAALAYVDPPNYTDWNAVRKWQQQIYELMLDRIKRTGAFAAIDIVILGNPDGSGTLLATHNGAVAFDIAGLDS